MITVIYLCESEFATEGYCIMELNSLLHDFNPSEEESVVQKKSLRVFVFVLRHESSDQDKVG